MLTHTVLIVGIFANLVAADCGDCQAEQPSADRQPGPQDQTDARIAEQAGRPVKALLWNASDIALQQDDSQVYWTGDTLLDITRLQICTRDFIGARRSIRASYDGQERGLLLLAEALARDGQWEAAIDTLVELDPAPAHRQADIDDRVRLRWVEHLVASGDLERAVKAIDGLKSRRSRPEALRNLAVAFVRQGDAARSAEYFERSIQAAEQDKKPLDRALALSNAADAQLALGEVAAAKATTQRLILAAESMEPFDRNFSLRHAAVLSARANDRPAAERLFGQAISALEKLDVTRVFAETNKNRMIAQIAVAQADVGYFDAATRTLSTVTDSASDREEALCGIAKAYLKRDDVDAALRTALLLQHSQHRDDALGSIVDYEIAHRDLKAALEAARSFAGPSARARAILTVAAASARLGDRQTAAEVAAKIDLASRDEMRKLFFGPMTPFDFRAPSTWGNTYEGRISGTSLSRSWAIGRAMEVAAAAMTLAQSIEQPPDQPYDAIFKELHSPEIIRALARAHAASGRDAAALDWAQRIGSDGKASDADPESTWRVQQRVEALIGVAEGILDQSEAETSKK